MKNRNIFILPIVAGLLLVAAWSAAPGLAQDPIPGGQAPGDFSVLAPLAPLGTGFTYQGRLSLDGAVVEGPCDFQFSLWDSAAGNTGQVGATQTFTAAPVSQGNFAISSLDFGAGAFNGQARWLQVAVRCPAGSGSYTPLEPRQPLKPAPYSLFAASALWGGLSGVPAGFADGIDDNTVESVGAGLVLTGTHVLEVDFAGSGAADTVARSDHDHWGQSWNGNDFGLTLLSTAGFGNSTAFTARSINQGTGVLGLATPSNASASLTVPTGVAGISLLPAGGLANRTYGVYGQANGTGGIGVYGYSTYTGTLGIANGQNGNGVYGEATGSNGTGVRGQGTANGVYGSGVNGVYGFSSINSATGVIGEANNGSLAFGVWGISSSGYAGYFSGKVNVTGNLTKSGGSFRIDHPLDPENQYLSHSFVESPDMKNIYDGVATLDENGSAVVVLPDWFEVLNRDFRYQLTCIGGYAQVYIAQEIQGNTFVIAGGTPGLKVSWQVTGIRQDPWANDNRIQVEEPKPAEEIGTYLYPQGYGQPESLAADYVREQRLADDRNALAPDSGAGQPTQTGPGVQIDWDDNAGQP